MSTTSRRIFTTVCLVLTGLVIGIPSAFAHHSVLSGSVACATDGHAVVTWHLVNSEDVTGSNRTEVVDTATLTSGTLTGIAAGLHLGPQTAPNSGTPFAAATSTYPGTQTGPVTLTIAAHWINSNGTAPNPAITNTTSAAVTLGGTCKTPSNPSAAIANSCADGGVKIVLTNGGQTGTSFEVTKNGAHLDTVAVAGGGSVTKTYPMTEDETSTFRAKADKYDSGDVSVTHDCTKPAASIANSCADGGVKIVLTNGGVNGTSFDIFKNGTKIDTVAVAAGDTVTKIYPMTEDETSTFRAKADNYDSGNVSVTHDCTKPAASIANSCADGGVKIVLTNGGVSGTSFEVTKNGTHLDTVAVAAGGQVTKTYLMNEDETATFRAKADNYDSGNVSVTHDCTNPAAAISNSCSSSPSGVVFKLSNGGLLPVSFELTKNGNHLDTISVPAAGSTTKSYAMAEDETAVFRATGSNFDSKNVSITHNCTNPGAVVANSCAAGGAVFTLTNTGVSATSFEVTKNGTHLDTVAVAAGATVTKTYAMAEDETSTFRAKADNFDSKDVSITHNCTNPGATVANSCSAGGAVFVLTNTGELPDSFVISKNGADIETVAVAASSTVTKTYAMAEDETSVFRAKTADGFDSGNKSITHNCTSPAASVTNSCSAGGAVFSLSNGGANPVTFAISRNGAAVDSVPVGGFATVTKTYTMAEDEKSIFQAKTAGFDSGAISVTHDCAPAVLGVQFNAPAPAALPRTGSNALPLALRGIALLMLGFVLVRFTGMLRRSNDA